MTQNTTSYSSYAENFRQEVLDPFFNCIKSAESCHLVGAGSMGKTRLMDYLMLPEVQNYYLGDESQKTILIRMDMNRLFDINDWGFYELGLTSTIQACGQDPELNPMIEQYIKTLWLPLLERPDALKALRYWELTINRICLQEFKLCFIFDEFDHVYEKLPANVFSHLRAMRDTNKISVCYALFLRNLPETLRPSFDNESFFELISRNLIGIKPYLPRDTVDMISKLEKRRNHPIQFKSTRDKIHDLSGGHPGIIQAIFSIIIERAENDPHVFDEGWLMRQESIKDECRKLFRSLEDNEQIRIAEFAQSNFTKLSASDYKILRTKGLLVANGERLKLFSPLFDLYLKQINIDALKETLKNHSKECSG